MSRVYLDHNATSPLRPEVAAAMIERLGAGRLGNPSSVHASGRAARHLLEQARERLAALLGCERDQLVFTSGGTESVNLALTAGQRVAVAATSHPAARQPARQRGGVVVPVDGSGVPRLDTLAASDLLSVPHAHHETGHVLDLAVLADATHHRGGVLHADACQAFGRVPIDMAGWDVDLLSVCAHKLGGPVGIGALVVGERATPEPLIRGGQQELGLRPGTESALLAEAFAFAAELAVRQREERSLSWSAWRDVLRDGARSADPHCRILTPSTSSLPNTLCVSFPGRPGSALVQRLDLDGVDVSHGSACASGSQRPSDALLALGHDEDVARGALRISMGHDTTVDDVRTCVERLAAAVAAVPPRDAAPKKVAPPEV